MEGLSLERIYQPAPGLWLPFPGEGDENYTEGWWADEYRDSEKWTPHVARLNGTEVARVELDWESDVPAATAAVIPRGRPVLEVERIDVHRAHRGRGIGAAVVRLIVQLHPEYQAIARAPDAAAFWDAVGWRRHKDSDGSYSLFLAPNAAG